MKNLMFIKLVEDRVMRHALIKIAFGLLLPIGLVQASVESDLKAGLPLQTILANAQAANISTEAALRQVLELAPDQAYAAITAAIQANPDQAANIVSIALAKQFNLNPAQVVAAGLQGAPDKAGVIVSTAIVKSPSYYTVPIVQRALAEKADGSKFVPQAMRTAPRQADSILTQALRSAPQQTRAIMEAVIADQPDKAASYVQTALNAKAPASDVLAAAFKVAPRQANAIAAAASDAGTSSQTIAAAANVAGVDVSSVTGGNYSPSSAGQSGLTLPPMGSPSAGGGGGGGSTSPH